MLDMTTEAGRRADQRLRQDEVAWLTTVRSDGQPQPVPVWFLWDGETLLVYSRPNQKVRNIRHNPRVSLHLNTDEHGGHIVRVDGRAEIDATMPPATGVPAMIEKYRAGIGRIGMTPESFAAEYSAPIRIRPEHWVLW